MDTLTNKENPLLLKEIEEYLKKGVKQREIAKLTHVSLVTVNKYCKRIKNNFKKEEREHRAKKREVIQRIELVKELRENSASWNSKSESLSTERYFMLTPPFLLKLYHNR